MAWNQQQDITTFTPKFGIFLNFEMHFSLYNYQLNTQ